jgi:hypothetical protein
MPSLCGMPPSLLSLFQLERAGTVRAASRQNVNIPATFCNPKAVRD